MAMVGEAPEKHVGRGVYVVSEKQVLKYREMFVQALQLSRARVAIILGGTALKLSTGLVGGVDAWRGYVEPPSTMPATIAVKTLATRYRAADKRCGCVTFKLDETPAAAGGKRRKRIKVIDAECRVCEGQGVVARKGDVIVYKKAQVVRPPLSAVETLQRFIATFDPAGMRRMGFALMPVMAADLRRAGRAVRGELKMAPTHFETSPTIFPAGGDVAVDIETVGRTMELERIGIANEVKTWTMPWSSAGQNAARSVLADAKRVIIHNVGFDEPRLRAAGAQVPVETPIFCTMLGTYMVQPDGKKGLNYAISLFLDAERHKHLSGDMPAMYNALDTRRTFDLVAPLTAELERTGQRQWFEKWVMPAARTLIRMSERGVRVDEIALAEWRGRLVVDDAALTAQWMEWAPGVNPNAAGQVAKHFGLQSADEDALKAVLRMGASPAIETLLALRTTRKLMSTYTDIALSEDGCVHPSYLPGQKDDDSAAGKGIAYSGRWTARDPNLQQVPPIARRVYVAHNRETHVLLEADWRQFELRSNAALAGDEVLVADLEAEDFFGVLAAQIGADRKVVKTGVYLSSYLGSPKTLHKKFQIEGVRITYGECVAFQKALFSRYRKWDAYRQRIIAEVDAKRELRNAFGKWAPFPGGRGDAPKAVNFLPQSTNACVATIVLPQLEAALAPMDARLLTLVHDSVLVEVPRRDVSRCADVVREIMEQKFEQVAKGFRVPVSMKVGESWGQMKEVESVAV
jgi:DNA polymerase I-like protein with 3'-5' exonuclease and polymerase domains